MSCISFCCLQVFRSISWRGLVCYGVTSNQLISLKCSLNDLLLLFFQFYAPWCGHCKKLEPIWNQVSQSLYPPVVRVAQVDCTRFSAVATQYKVKGFPTLLLYATFCIDLNISTLKFMFLSSPSMKNGETFHYNGERSREALVDYAERMALPPIQAIGEATILKERLDARQRFFLYVGENEGATWVSNFFLFLLLLLLFALFTIFDLHARLL